MQALIGAFLKGLGEFIARLVSDWRRDRALEAQGRAEGEADLNKIVSEGSDDQATVNAADRGRADDVLERLRKRIDQRP